MGPGAAHCAGAAVDAGGGKLAKRLAAMPRHAMAAQKRLNNRLTLRYMAWLEDEISLAFDK